MRFRRRLFGTTCSSGSIRASGSFAVDAAGLTYISSSGLRLLLQVAKQLEERSGRVVLCALQESVRRVLEIAGFTSLFGIFSSPEEAIQDCQRD